MKDYESKLNKYAELIGSLDIVLNVDEILNDEPESELNTDNEDSIVEE